LDYETFGLIQNPAYSMRGTARPSSARIFDPLPDPLQHMSRGRIAVLSPAEPATQQPSWVVIAERVPHALGSASA